jgi:hypothetical protein
MKWKVAGGMGALSCSLVKVKMATHLRRRVGFWVN